MVTAGFNPEKRVEAAEGGPQGDIRETVRSACGKIAAAYAAKDFSRDELPVYRAGLVDAGPDRTCPC